MAYKDPEARKAYDRERWRRLKKDGDYIAKKNKKSREREYKKYHNDSEHREKLLKRQKQRAFNKKTRAIEYTGGLQCHGEDCLHMKHDEPIDLFNIDFHHVIAENKTMDFTKLFRGFKWPRIKEEIDNCAAIPLCRMCHGKEEHGK